MTNLEIFSILIIHWIGDFICQTDWQAKNKSTHNKALFLHVLSYTMVWFFAGAWFFYAPVVAIFCLITFMAHFITDYFTSRLNTKLYTDGKIHWFFVSIGFDQILHYIQLFLTYQFLKQYGT